MDFDRLDELLKESGLSRAFLATKLNRKRSIFTDWKNNKSKPSDEQLKVIADTLDVSIDYLIGKTDIKKDPAETGSLDETDKIALALLNRLTPDEKKRALEYLDLLLSQAKYRKDKK